MLCCAARVGHTCSDTSVSAVPSALVLFVLILGQQPVRAPGSYKKLRCPPHLQVEEVFQQAHNCAQCFAGLVELTKKHKTRNQLLGTALKCGGAFIDVMVKAADFWYAYYLANGRPFQQLVKTVQKGTKTMQVIFLVG